MAFQNASSRCFLFLFYLAILSQVSVAQVFVITGKVTDAQTNEPIAFANVSLKGKNTGATTDFEGKYILSANSLTDSIWVAYLGYFSKTKVILPKLKSQVIDIQLVASVSQLREVVVRRGENPAYPILRKIWENKDRLNRSSLIAYEFESYSKTELDVNNMSEKFRQKKPMRKVMEYMDKLQKMAGEDGKPLLPVFISEMVSRQHYRSSPKLYKSKILKTHTTGVGIKDESILTQLIGGSFQPFNFYDNWIRIIGKDFMSPIADGGKSTYEYYLADSMQVGNYDCYVIDFDPKRPQDLAFRGKMWIDKTTFALVEIDATVGKEANINYVDKIKISQELEPTNEGPWVPVKMRTLVDVGQLTENSAGMLAKYYVSNKDFLINKPQDTKFYSDRVDLDEDYKSDDEDTTYWNKKRHDVLSTDEKKVYALVDSLKNLPIVRNYIDIIDMGINGHIKTGPIEWGPLPFSYAHNNIEGSRIRLGFRTNQLFSKNLFFKGYVAGGTLDKKLKYGFELDYVLSRKPWAMIGFRKSFDLERLGINADDVGPNNLFLAFNRYGRYNKGYLQHENYGFVRATLFKGFQQTIGLRTRTFSPIFNFGYYANPELGNASAINTDYQSTELVFETRYAPDEVIIQNDFKMIEGRTRGRRGIPKWPVFTLKYNLGIKALGSDFDYQRLMIGVQHSFRTGIFGRTYYNFSAGTSPSRVPYPLLFPHLGNNSIFYTDNAYNLMSIGEFVSTSFAALKVRQDLEGVLFNRIPLIRKLKWRSDLLVNVLYGENNIKYRQLHPYKDQDGNYFLHPGTLNSGKPYIELGYGINNIFKFLRVEFIHRVTYLETTNRAFPVRPFGIRIAGQFRL